MNSLFDSHSHVQDPVFDGEVDAVVKRAREAGVNGLLVLGYDLPSSRAAITLARRHPEVVFPAAGIHPHDAVRVAKQDRDDLAELAAEEDVVAVGETGLDFFRNLSPREEQLDLLNFHLELALRLGKPVSLHSRAAEGPIRPPLEEFAARWQERWPGRSPGVMHCFGGSPAQARDFTALGFLVSVACVVTYPSADTTRELAASLPLDSLLIETDSPYLPPQHSRGLRNEPAFVVDACEAVAKVRGVTAADIAAATTANAAALFGIGSGRRASTVHA